MSEPRAVLRRSTQLERPAFQIRVFASELAPQGRQSRQGRAPSDRAAFQLAKVFPAQPTLMSETVFAQATAFPQLQQALRQPLADAFGVVVGVVVVRRGGQGGSSPWFCCERAAPMCSQIHQLHAHEFPHQPERDGAENEAVKNEGASHVGEQSW